MRLNLKGRYNVQDSLLQLFPMEKRVFWRTVAGACDQIQEIRLRSNKPITLIMDGREFFLDKDGRIVDNPGLGYRAESEEINALLNHICHYSLYAFEDEVRQGFITVPGGHRVGIVGQVVLEKDGSVRTIKHISCINIRIAHQIYGAADKVLPHIYDKGRLKNTLIVSPPCCGKTTLLRDMIRQISDGNAYGPGMCVGVVDERSEIAGSYQGIPQNDVGMRTDVLDACPKALGMMLLLRSMSPRVIAVDELGGEEDMQALHMAASCGSRIIATVHGADLEDVVRRFKTAGRSLEQLFDCYLILARERGKPVIKEIMGRDEFCVAVHGRNHDNIGMLRTGDVVSPAISGALENLAQAPWYFGNINE